MPPANRDSKDDGVNINKDNLKGSPYYFKKRIVDFLSSNIFSYILLISIFMFFSIIPTIYSWHVKFPDEKDVHFTEGIFTFKNLGKSGYQPGLIINGEEVFFSCKSSSLGRHVCEMDKKVYKNSSQLEQFEKWLGKKASVGWFLQKTDFFSPQRRIVKLVVDGKVKITEERVKKAILDNKKILKIMIAFQFIIFFLCLFFMKKVLKKEGVNHVK